MTLKELLGLVKEKEIIIEHDAFYDDYTVTEVPAGILDTSVNCFGILYNKICISIDTDTHTDTDTDTDCQLLDVIGLVNDPEFVIGFGDTSLDTVRLDFDTCPLKYALARVWKIDTESGVVRFWIDTDPI